MISRFACRWHTFVQEKHFSFLFSIDKSVRIFASRNVSGFLQNRDGRRNGRPTFPKCFSTRRERGASTSKGQFDAVLLSFSFLATRLEKSSIARSVLRFLDPRSSITIFEFSSREGIYGVAMSAMKIYIYVSLSLFLSMLLARNWKEIKTKITCDWKKGQ